MTATPDPPPLSVELNAWGHGEGGPAADEMGYVYGGMDGCTG